MTGSRSAYGLDGVNFFIAAVQTAFGAFVTVYLVESHWPAASIGLALSVATISNMIWQMPGGAFVDNLHDRRWAVWLGGAGVGLAALLLAANDSKAAVYAALTLQGLASALIGPGIAAVSLALVGRKGFSTRIGRNARAASIGNGITAGLMGFAGAYFSSASIFLMAALLTVPALLSLTLVRASDAVLPGSEQRTDITWKSVKALALDRRLMVFMACVTLYFCCSASMLPGIAGRVATLHPEIATLVVAGTILAPQGIVALISPWVGRSADRFGRRPLLLLGWGLVPLPGLMFAAIPDTLSLVVGLAINGVSGAVFGVMMTLVAADLTQGTGRFNLTLGALGVAVSVGASLSTAFAGIVVGLLGSHVAWLALGAAGLAGFALLWFAMPETHATQVPPQKEGNTP